MYFFIRVIFFVVVILKEKIDVNVLIEKGVNLGWLEEKEGMDFCNIGIRIIGGEYKGDLYLFMGFEDVKVLVCFGFLFL